MAASPMYAQSSSGRPSPLIPPAFGAATKLPPLVSTSSSLAPEREENPTEAVSDKPIKLKKLDFNRDIFYRSKLEFSVESGWLPLNIPLVFDFLTGSPYTTHPTQPYTMIPNLLSVRWMPRGTGGPLFLRGNLDLTVSGSYTDVVRGPETRYFAFDFGVRRNFIQPRWRVTPYFEMRGGVGNIDAKGKLGVVYGQGQDLTFTYMCGSGVRYNFNPKYSISGGLNYMHVSNLYLSEPAVENYGINVYGPMFGFNVRLGKPNPLVTQ